MRFIIAALVASCLHYLVAARSSSYDYCNGNPPSASSYLVPPSSDELQNIQVITRHGARTPVNLLLHDDAVYDDCPDTSISVLSSSSSSSSSSPYRSYRQIPSLSQSNPYSKSLWKGNCIVGQLTKMGIQQHVKLGRHLRQIYVDKLKFLSDSYEPQNSTIHIRSTDVWRTKQSAESLLTGLYPSSTTPSFPIYTYPQEVETMYSNPDLCPAFQRLNDKIMNSTSWASHMSEHKDLLDRVITAMRMKDASSDWFTSFDHAFDQAHVRYCHHKPLHCNVDHTVCINITDIQQLETMCDWEYNYYFQGYDRVSMARLGISGFLSEITRVLKTHTNQGRRNEDDKDVEMNANVNESENKRMMLYSGHDTTIGPLLAAWAVDGWRVPPYATSLILELWKRSATQSTDPYWYVRLINNGHLVKLPWCSQSDSSASAYECELNAFLAFNDKLIPEDLMKECA